MPKSVKRAYEEWKDSAPLPTDAQIKTIVVDRLHENPVTKNEEIAVDVAQAVVILGGEVSSLDAKRAAARVAWETEGVADVKDELRASA